MTRRCHQNVIESTPGLKISCTIETICERFKKVTGQFPKTISIHYLAFMKLKNYCEAKGDIDGDSELFGWCINQDQDNIAEFEVMVGEGEEIEVL